MGHPIFAKTSKALTRLNEMFRTSEVKETYWAVVKNAPKEPEGELVHYLARNEKQNKSFAYDKEVPNSKKAILNYRLIGHSENYYLLEVDLKTGRHHQIRCQLAKMGCPIKGDLKYGAAVLYLLSAREGTVPPDTIKTGSSSPVYFEHRLGFRDGGRSRWGLPRRRK